MATPAKDWHAKNQAYLGAWLALLRARLGLAAARGDDERSAAAAALTAAEAAHQAEAGFHSASALGRLAEELGLTDFECQLLMLCAGVELDPEIARLTAQLRGTAQGSEASFGIALSCLEGAHWSAVSPQRPLRYWHCLELHDRSVTRAALQIDERSLAYLLGINDLDARLIDCSRPLAPAEDLPPSQQALADNVLRCWQDAEITTLGLDGPCAADRLSVIGRAAGTAGFAGHLLRASDLPAEAGERRLLQRLWTREAILQPLCLVIEVGDQDSEETARHALDFAEDCHCRVVVSARQRLAGGRAVAWLTVASPGAAEQEALWRRALGKKSNGALAELPRVLSQFDLGAAEIARIGRQRRAAGAKGPSLWQSCRALAEPRLAALADRLQPTATWDDLVLPEREVAALREIAAQVRNRFTVYHRWGMAAPGSRGRGVTALFAGPSGTGKTMAAEVLAGALDLDLYRIDLSAVVSKYIGETEKNLRRIFDAAEGGGVVLLFDEADALFGERSQVSDSHDRYANIEIAYLLQRMESFSGLSILTSNIRDAIDQAFLRRLRFLIDFPFPDRVLRQAIWRRAFPATAESEPLNLERLAQLNIAGGTIRNIALNAAFIAADQQRPIAMEHLYRAASHEYAKMDRPLSPAEMEGWR